MPREMTIPEVREELVELSSSHGLPRLRQLARELERAPVKRRAPNKAPPMTPEMQRKVREAARKDPTLTQSDLAAQFKVNAGRISEALNGKRGRR